MNENGRPVPKPRPDDEGDSVTGTMKNDSGPRYSNPTNQASDPAEFSSAPQPKNRTSQQYPHISSHVEGQPGTPRSDVNLPIHDSEKPPRGSEQHIPNCPGGNEQRSNQFGVSQQYLNRPGGNEQCSNCAGRSGQHLNHPSCTEQDPPQHPETDPRLQPDECYPPSKTPGDDFPAKTTSGGNEKEVRELREQIEKLQREMKQQQLIAIREKNDLVRKTQKLNQMIIKNAQPTRNELSDNDAETAIAEIRQLITGIVRSNFEAEKISIDKQRVRQLGEDDFYRKFETRPRETRRRMFMAKIFMIIKSQVFDIKHFGLDESMDACMQDFEKMITGNVNIDMQDVDEWRRRTVTCAALLNLDLNKRVTAIATNICNVLLAAELSGPKGNSKRAVDDLYGSLYMVCEKAIRLALRMRASRSKYTLETFKASTALSQIDKGFYEPTGSEGQISEPLDQGRVKIFCTEFGALVKTKDALSDEGEKRVVLCPAQVFVYEDPSDSHRSSQR